MSRPELLEQLADKTRAMRAAQKAFFAARRADPRADHFGLLDASRRLEREVDQLLAELDAPPSPQTSLF